MVWAAIPLGAACSFGDGGGEKTADADAARSSAQADSNDARVRWDLRERQMTAEEMARARLDTSWQEVVQLDTTGAGSVRPIPETWEQISDETVNRGPMHLPIAGDVAGPSVMRVQILLNRAFFSPGMMDGRWGKNTAQALYWLQKREGLPATARVDSATFAKLTELAGAPTDLVRRYTLAAEDLKGPFIDIPDDIHEQAKLDCSCYESLTERLTEQFAVTEEVLKAMNPGVEINSLRVGQPVNVPAVRNPDARAQGQVSRLVVSGRGNYLHAVDGSGRVLLHFPTTLGATYDPSPSGAFRVTRVTRDPWWHFQPDIIESVADTVKEERIPPGPNNRVGVVWMALSEPHYGIHGTHSPETIGYASSAGCVRLTNWDASFLAGHISRGNVPVEFRDIQGRAAGGGEESENAARASTSGAAAGGSGAGASSRTGADSAKAGRSGSSSGSGGGEAQRSGSGRSRDTARSSTGTGTRGGRSGGERADSAKKGS